MGTVGLISTGSTIPGVALSLAEQITGAETETTHDQPNACP
jgi:hypothetical protein